MFKVEGLYGLAIHENYLYGTMHRNNTIVQMDRLDSPLVTMTTLIEEVRNPSTIKVVHRQRQPVDTRGRQ